MQQVLPIFVELQIVDARVGYVTLCPSSASRLGNLSFQIRLNRKENRQRQRSPNPASHTDETPPEREPCLSFSEHRMPGVERLQASQFD